MTGASDAAAKLKANALAGHGNVAAAIAGLRSAVQRLREAEGIEAAMSAAVGLALAAEAARGATKALHDEAYEVLRTAMEETGAPPFRIATHVASLCKSPQRAVIIDPKLIPVEYMTEPRPDRQAITNALRSGLSIPGAELDNGGPSYLRLTPLKTER